MRNILIICDEFPPFTAPRMGYLTKFLKEFNYNAFVITDEFEIEKDFSFLSQDTHIQYIDKKKIQDNKILFKLRKLIASKFIYSFDKFGKNNQFYKLACQCIQLNEFDIILTSTWNYIPIRGAMKAAEKNNLPIIVDLRDILEQFPETIFKNENLRDLLYMFRVKISDKIIKWQRNKVIKKANFLTTISPWHKSYLNIYNKNVKLIYNGYDPELFYPVLNKTSKFIITYTGRIYYSSLHDPSLLFMALKLLIENEEIEINDLEINMYSGVKSIDEIRKYINKNELNNYLYIKEYIPAEKIPQILNNSSILLLLANKSDEKGPKGIMTTKFFEYLAVNRPILCVTSDEGVLESALNEANAGIAARNVEQAYNFILEKYHEWKKLGYTISKTNMELIKKYSRKEQAKQFAELFDEVISSHKKTKK